MTTLKAPFPWFGGKSRVSHLVWNAFGDVANYVEPFAGSLAVLLGRPSSPRIETVNDLDCYVSNFWRSLQYAPEEVARWADWPVNEIDLHARHRWLVAQSEFRERMRGDPEYFDARVAGWWVWGICQWIGSGWCTTAREQMPMLRGDSGAAGAAGAGIHASGLVRNQLPDLGGNGGAAGKGVHASALAKKLPLLSSGSGAGTGVHAKLVKMDRGTRSRLQGPILDWMLSLAERLRRVRVCCGDWTRVLGRSATELIGTTGIFLDPPYDEGEIEYSAGGAGVSAAVREWAIANGKNKKLRIALCGYEGEHEMPADWQCVAWKAAGGYAAAAGNAENSAKERIWFSPHCARAEDQADLFTSMGGAA